MIEQIVRDLANTDLAWRVRAPETGAMVSLFTGRAESAR